ncbi:succinoglycan biosynthesis protein ExoO [Roseovarius azorensis]|uniref:Succinoglycan biosynthesis protein ExoO n=1 Tax=Roseovarius azorensis TaxID=1287727 RepID=A0A1H7KLN6_9RHOB|nr:glycosyltransferase family 2 protein [Roseovarius azorensis]SEK87709.1 succinoglycan biosynthesis protein ExoO [Roseovarius azorensis]
MEKRDQTIGARCAHDKAAKRPIVSVIMANFNGAAHLESAVHSVLAQSLENLELLFADDASTDASVRLMTEIIAQDRRVKLLRSDVNAGPAAARNRALDMARGTWIAIVDSDDLLHPERFERLTGTAHALEADAIADDLIRFHDGTSDSDPGTLLGDTRQWEPLRITPAMMLGKGAAGPLGYLKPMFRSERIGALRYREDIRIGEDHEFYMRFLLRGGKMYLTPQSYYLYRQHPASISHRLKPADLNSMIRAQDDLTPLMTGPERAIASRRRIEMEQARRLEACVADIRAWRILPTLGRLVRHPKTALAFAQLVCRRLASRRRRKNPRPEVASELLLAPPDGYLPNHAGLGHMSRHIAIPHCADAWTGADWAKVTAVTQHPATQVIAVGAVGLFALGYVSAPRRALLGQTASDWPAGAQRLLANGYAVISPGANFDHPDARTAARRIVSLVPAPASPPARPSPLRPAVKTKAC